jgi:predicted ATPase
MLSSIWVRNLGCFDEGEHRADFAPLTILVGPNNVGKSVLIAGFNMLRNTLIRGGLIEYSTSTYNFGDFSSAVYNHKSTSRIDLGARVTHESKLIDVTARFQAGGYEGATFDPSANSKEALEGIQSCWYFRASRSEVSQQAQVGQSGQYTPWNQKLDPSGSNIISFLLERWTDQDPKWSEAQEWLKKLDPELSILKSPLRGNVASLVTTNRYSKVDVNIAFQGTGVQKAVAVMAAIIFSPKGSTIIVEEPEVHLHKNSQEVLANLFNWAVNHEDKQVIFSTHSWDMLLPYISDIAQDMRKRGSEAERIDPKKFRMNEFTRKEGKIAIKEFPLGSTGFKEATGHFGQLLG